MGMCHDNFLLISLIDKVAVSSDNLTKRMNIIEVGQVIAPTSSKQVFQFEIFSSNIRSIPETIQGRVHVFCCFFCLFFGLKKTKTNQTNEKKRKEKIHVKTQI